MVVFVDKVPGDFGDLSAHPSFNLTGREAEDLPKASDSPRLRAGPQVAQEITFQQLYTPSN
jgi:hypothetical protein